MSEDKCLICKSKIPQKSRIIENGITYQYCSKCKTAEETLSKDEVLFEDE